MQNIKAFNVEIVKNLQVDEISVDSGRRWGCLLTLLLTVGIGCLVSYGEENLVMDVNLFLFLLQRVERSYFSVD